MWLVRSLYCCFCSQSVGDVEVLESQLSYYKFCCGIVAIGCRAMENVE